MKAKGGMDGVIIAFGDGCDSDTLQMVLSSFLTNAWNTEFYLKDRSHFTGTPIEVVVGEDGEPDVTYHPWDEDADELNETLTLSVKYDDIVKLEVY